MQESLEQESAMLSHVEDIKTALFEVENLLGTGHDGNGTTDRVKDAVRSLENITDIYPETKELAERMESCYIELKDILQEVSSHAANIEFDPQRLESINTQLDRIYTLEQKHNVTTVGELLEIKNTLAAKLDRIDNSDEEMARMVKRGQELGDECERLAEQLTTVRTEAAKKIENEMPERLVPLGITKVRFAVNIDKKNICDDGHDRVSFLFSANTNTPMQPVAQVASGGEIARVMLSIKAMISGAVKLPTIIFDEIDTGVSGKIAEKWEI